MRAHYTNYTGSGSSSRFNDAIINIADGSTIFFDIEANRQGVVYYTGTSILVALDVNGYRNHPNKYGYDFFVFQLEESGKLIPMGADTNYYPGDIYCSPTSSLSENGFGCTNKAITDPEYFNDI